MGLDRGSDIFSFVVGGLALISTIVSVLLFVRGYLPAAQMKVLDELLNETKGIYEKADADGLLPNEDFRTTIQTRLTQFDNARETLRSSTYQAMTSQDQIRAFIAGLSKTIMAVTSELKKLRWYLVSTTQREKERRQSECGWGFGQPHLLNTSAPVSPSHDGNDRSIPPSVDGESISGTVVDGVYYGSSESPTSNFDGVAIVISPTSENHPKIVVPEFDLSTIVTPSYQVPSHCLRCSLGIHSGCLHPIERDLLAIGHEDEHDTPIPDHSEVLVDKPIFSKFRSFIRSFIGHTTSNPEHSDIVEPAGRTRSPSISSRSSTLIADSLPSSSQPSYLSRWWKQEEVREECYDSKSASRPSYSWEIVKWWRGRFSGPSPERAVGRVVESLPV